MPPSSELALLARKALWLSCWTIHAANHLRETGDGLKVGGHQASCASMVDLLAALYLRDLRPEDRVAVKPHAGPVFHAIQYLLGAQSRRQLEAFRGWGGAQSYPSRTKDATTWISQPAPWAWASRSPPSRAWSGLRPRQGLVRPPRGSHDRLRRRR
jgi:pyruvate dehydrogenase complex dehydrogenase (E1) component